MGQVQNMPSVTLRFLLLLQFCGVCCGFSACEKEDVNIQYDLVRSVTSKNVGYDPEKITYTYDDENRCIRQDGPDHESITYEYSSGQLKETQYYYGQQIRQSIYQLNSEGFVIQDLLFSYTYDDNNHLIRKQKLSDLSSFEIYDWHNDNLVKVTYNYYPNYSERHDMFIYSNDKVDTRVKGIQAVWGNPSKNVRVWSTSFFENASPRILSTEYVFDSRGRVISEFTKNQTRNESSYPVVYTYFD